MTTTATVLADRPPTPEEIQAAVTAVVPDLPDDVTLTFHPNRYEVVLPYKDRAVAFGIGHVVLALVYMRTGGVQLDVTDDTVTVTF